MEDHTQFARPELERELEKLLGSSIFLHAPRSRSFLEYVVRRALEDKAEKPKEYTIAVEVFGCAPSYDPSIDATVRVEAGRLRARLRDYYAAEGKDDAWIIEMPKGAYRATFLPRTPAPSLLQPEQPPPASPSPVQPSPAFRPSAALVLLLVAFALLTAFAFAFWRVRVAREKGTSVQAISLAIPLFENLTSNPSEDSTAELITDDLQRQFTDVPSLQVVHPRGPLAPAASPSARRLLLAGTLRRGLDNRLAIAVQLSRLDDGVILLDRQYLPDGSDLRSVQADIFADVVRALRIDPEATTNAAFPEGVPHPLDPALLATYNKASAATSNSTPEGLRTSIALLQSVVARDPAFARAWVALAESHVLLGLYFESPRDHMPLARAAAERALALDSSLQEAHGTLGIIHLFYDWDYAAAQAEVTTAAADASAINKLACFSHLLERTGNTRHAEEEILRLLAFDPRSAALISELGCIEYYRGSYDEAVAHYREALKADPHSPIPYWGLGKSLDRQGKSNQALQALRAFRQANGFEPPVITAEIGYVEGRAGHAAAAHAAIGQLQNESRTSFVDPYLIALIYHSLGQDESAFDYLQGAFAVRSPFLMSITTEPKWKSARTDPRFQNLVAHMFRTEPTRTAPTN